MTEQNKRRKRGARKESTRRLTIVPRDERIMTFVGRAGVVERACIERLFWENTSGASTASARRIRILCDHGLLQSTVVSLNSPNRVTITQRAADLIGGRQSDGFVPRPKVRATTSVADHMIAIANVWSAIILRLRETPMLRVIRFITEAETRRALHETRGALIPDGIITIGESSPVVTLALEVDLGHERVNALIDKAGKYAPHLLGQPLYGLHIDAVLIVATGIARLRRLAAAFTQVGAAAAAYFLDLQTLGSDTVLDRLATAPALLSQPPLSDPFATSLLGEQHVLTN